MNLNSLTAFLTFALGASAVRPLIELQDLNPRATAPAPPICTPQDAVINGNVSIL